MVHLLLVYPKCEQSESVIIPHMPLTELDNDSESVWVKLFVNKKTHFVASWYRPPVDGHLPVSDNGNGKNGTLREPMWFRRI